MVPGLEFYSVFLWFNAVQGFTALLYTGRWSLYLGFCLEGLYIGILIRVILGSIRTDKETTGLFKLYCSRVPVFNPFVYVY